MRSLSDQLLRIRREGPAHLALVEEKPLVGNPSYLRLVV